MKTRSKKLSKNVILLTITALALCASPAVALAEDILCRNPDSTTWTGTIDNNWFNPGNWTNGAPICSPDVSYYAHIDNGGTAQINTGAASACQVSLGTVNTTQSGTLSVDGSGSNLTTCSNTYVGYQGKGSLSITNGGVVTTDINASIASLTSSNGAATVDGTNSKWAVGGELDIGGLTNASGGTGLLTVKNSGSATAASVHAYGSGTLTGNGTVSTINGTTIDGTVAPNWTLTIAGALTFGIGGAMQCNVTPANLGSVDAEVLGTATLDGRLSVTMTGTFTPGTQFTLLHASGALRNTFSSVSITYPTNQCFTPQITYDYVGNHVYLYLEPCT